MIRFFLFLITIKIIQVSSFVATASHDEDHVLYVISMDAFRPEYLERRVTPFMQFLRDSGSFSPYMRPVFPSKTFVNHFSIATGLYAGTHGVLGNELYDADLGEVKYSYDLFHQNESVTPIWTLNELQGKNSGCMMWPGSDFTYQNKSCTFVQKYDRNSTWEDRITKTLDWILDPVTPANLIMHYIDEPDDLGHAFSPDSKIITNVVKKLDSMFTNLINQLYDRHLDHRVNIVIVSDHGMVTVPPANFIDLRTFLRPNTYQMVGTSPILQVIPAPGFENEVWLNLLNASALPDSHFNVFNKFTIPAKYRVNNDKRFGPILAHADIPYAFQDMYKSAEWFENNRNSKRWKGSKYGVHGYDNEAKEMRAIFFAYGPMFAKGKELKPFNNVDLFQFFCVFLKLKCIPTEGEDRSDIWNELLQKKGDPCLANIPETVRTRYETLP